jgi:hypothetical protein
MIKPGYKTSEFWFTFVSFIFSGLFLLGIIGENAQKEDLIQETSRGLEAVILIVGQLTVLYRYVKSRSDLKKTWWNEATPEVKQEVIKNSISKKKKKGTSNAKRTTTRKTSKTS